MKQRYLKEIMQWHRQRAAKDVQKRDPAESLEQLQKKAGESSSCEFSAALSSFGIIAELKKRSPSKGSLRPRFNPFELARDFEAAGAACISVLTDRKFFGGSLKDLQKVRKTTGLPILRKDFTCSILDVCDAFEAGAQAVLLIMSALGDSEVREYHTAAASLGMDTVFEIHTEKEMERVLAAADSKFPLCLLVNQRDLNTFREYDNRALELAPKIPEFAISIAASAVKSPEAVQSLKSSGYNAVLVGEYLMKSENPLETLQNLTLICED